jgi:hypothetical protein
VCISVCLTLPTRWMFFEQLRENTSQNTVGICKQITLLILYCIRSRLVILLKIFNAPLQVSDIFYIAVSFIFINFSFQIFFLFAPKMSASFTPYIFQIIHITLSWILLPLHFSLISFVLKT